MKKLLDIINLSVNYGTKINVLDNISFSIKSKQITAIIGESGSGKSTIAKAILNLLCKKTTNISGKILYKNKLLNDKTKWNNIYGNEIAIIFQNPAAYLNPIVKIEKQFVETLLNNQNINKKDAKNLAHKMLIKMNLNQTAKILNSYPYELSGGMIQRVMIAMIISLKPKLLIADEPTSALDIVTQKQIIKELINLKDELDTSIIFITHDISIASSIANNVIVLKDGKIVEQGSRDEVFLNSKHVYTKKLITCVIKVEEA